MKVLFNTYPMAFHTPGGGEMQLKAYQRYLPKFGVDVSLFDLWNPKFLEHDVVHFFSVMGGSVPFCRFVKQLNLPLVITSSLWITEETKHLYPWEEIRYHLSYADKIITNSQLETEQFVKVLDIPREKFSVVYNGIDPVFFNRTSPEIFRKHFKIDYPFVLNVGNIEQRKNQLNLLRAMQYFKDYKLITIGHIREKSYAEECFKLGGDQFVFLGPIDHDSELLRSAYAACEVFALPSTLETPGLAALEAAAQGAKIVVTAIGAPREYFKEYAFYVENPQSVEEMIIRIQGAINSKNNLKLAQKMEQEFRWNYTVQPLVEVYKNLKKSSKIL